ncbi:hypothetical protein BH11ACT3_BH11ACT3_24510 [soil metagenome]
MAISQWWKNLDDDTQLYLAQNMEAVFPPEVTAAVEAAGGPAVSPLPDDDVAWLEELNNGGSPEGS